MNATTAAQYAALRIDGRYRVIDRITNEYVATCASRAKAEEKAAKLNAEQDAPADEAFTRELKAEGDAARAAAGRPEELAQQVSAGEVSFDAAVSELLGVTVAPVVDRAQQAIDDARAYVADRAVTADTSAAPKLVSVWVGWRIADALIERRAEITDAALGSAADKLAARPKNKVLDRTIRLSFAECSALSAHCTDVETAALSEDTPAKDRGPLAYSARTLRDRLAAAWA